MGQRPSQRPLVGLERPCGQRPPGDPPASPSSFGLPPDSSENVELFCQTARNANQHLRLTDQEEKARRQNLYAAELRAQIAAKTAPAALFRGKGAGQQQARKHPPGIAVGSRRFVSSFQARHRNTHPVCPQLF